MSSTTIADAAVRDALTLILGPGSVAELRVLNTSKATVSGYFDDTDKLAQEAARWSGKAPAVYFTINPVHPDLLARAANRTKQYVRTSTSDGDILQRRWLPVDFDAGRPAGISSTGEEHEAALERATQCREWLRGLGFPEPVYADSGNGAHLLYHIDLPNDDESRLLVQRCLEALSLRFGDDVVAVDQTTYNAARIWKAYGTMACKGDHMPDRPHRLARLLEVPDEVEVTSRERVERLAAMVPAASADQPNRQNGPRAFDVAQWLVTHDLSVVAEGPWSGGRKWILAQCPWNAEHTDRSAYIVQHAGGAIGAGCQHNGCAGKGWHELRELYEPGASARSSSGTRPAAATSPHGQLPGIFAGEGDLPKVTQDAWAAIQKANEPPFLFRHGGLPVRIEVDDGTPGLKPLGLDKMRHVMARAADWFKIKEVVPAGGIEKEKVQVPAPPPVHVVRDVLATPDMPLPVLARLVEAPVFAPDSTLQAQPGYHAAGRTYYRPTPGFTIPEVAEHPTENDVRRARQLICDDLLRDFPFDKDADRAHAVCLIMLPFVRDLIPGATPLHLVEKPAPGTGASLLADIVAYPATGRPVTAMTEGRDEDEWRKRVTARLLASPAFVLIDNLRKRLESSALSSAITSIMWEDRVLGLSETVRVPVRCAWIATGNNPTLSAEIARRIVRIRLDAKTDRPWLREEFRHPNLRGWAAASRAELVWAALTMTKAWLAAGRPRAADVPTLGMFEDWAQVMGGILEVAGIPGFLSNLAEFYDASDTEGEQWRTLVHAWWDAWRSEPVGVGALFNLIASDEYTLFDLGDGNERSQKSRLGRALKGARDRQYDSLRITYAGTRQRAAQWRLVLTDQAAPPQKQTGYGDGDAGADDWATGEAVTVGKCEKCGNSAYLKTGVCKPCEVALGAKR